MNGAVVPICPWLRERVGPRGSRGEGPRVEGDGAVQAARHGVRRHVLIDPRHRDADCDRESRREVRDCHGGGVTDDCNVRGPSGDVAKDHPGTDRPDHETPPNEFGVARYRFWSSPPFAWTIERIEKIATRTRAGIHEMASENAPSAGFARLGPRNEPRTTRNKMLTTAVRTEVQRFPLRPR